MPLVSRFYGIVITIYFGDHGPPHFHARYGSEKAVFDMAPLRLRRGHLPRRAENFVLEWAALHQAELLDNWKRAEDSLPLERIPPLD